MHRAILLATALLATVVTASAQDRYGDPLPAGAVARLGTERFHRASCAAYAPNGKIIATADSAEVCLWDVATSTRIRRLPLANGWAAVGLIFSHDGRKLAIVEWGGTSVLVWDLHTFNTVRLVQANGGSAGGDWSQAAAFSADDKTLFAATSVALFVWDVASGQKLKVFPVYLKDDSSPPRMVVFSTDGKYAATRREKWVRIWESQTGKLLHDVEAASSGDTMKFSRDGKTLVVPGYGHWMNLFDVETGKKIRSVSVAKQVASLDFSRDGKILVAASNASRGSSSPEGDQVIQLWDLTRIDSPPVRFQVPGVHSVLFSPDGTTLAWGCYDQTLCFMDRATGKDLRPTASHRGAIKALVYLPDGKRIVSAGEDGDIRLWDAATGAALGVWKGHTGEVSGLAVFPNGKLLASCGRDRTFRLWDVARGKTLAVHEEGNAVVAAAFSADGKHLASGGHRGVLFLRDPATGKVLDEMETDTIASLAFAPNGKTLAAVVDHPDKVLLLDLGTRTTKDIALENRGTSAAYSPDGSTLAVGCEETLLLIDTVTHAVRKTLPGHFNRRGCAVFSPDGRYLASVSDGYGRIANRTIRVFEMSTGTEIHSFKKELPIYAAAFSPDCSKLVVGGADATALVLDLTNLTGKQRREQLPEKEPATHWESLTALDAGAAYEARADLLYAPKSALPFLADRLQPAPALDAGRMAGLIGSLDSKSFRERDAATRELEQLGELVRAPLRKALTGNTTLELRRRLESLLEKLEPLSPTQVRSLRAIEILDGIGTPAALRIVERLTQGNPDGLLTVESRAVLARRERKNATLPEIPRPQESSAIDSRPLRPPGPVLQDRDGDAMPPGAIARLGSARWRLAAEPRRLLASPDGKRLAVLSDAGVDLFDAQTGKRLGHTPSELFSWGSHLRTAVALSPDWRTVAAQRSAERAISVFAFTDREKRPVMIDFARPKESFPVVPEEIEEAGSHSSGTIQYLAAATFSPDARTLVGAAHFGWHAQGGKITRELKETHLVAWESATGKQLWKSPALPYHVNTIVCSPDGKTLTVVDRSGVGFWDLTTRREMRRWPSSENLWGAEYSSDRSWLVTASPGQLLLWDVATGKVRQRLALPGKDIPDFAISPDGKLLAGGSGTTIRFWEPQTGKALGDCAAVANPVATLAFSGDGKTLYSGHAQEHVVRRWDVVGRKSIDAFNSPRAPVRQLSFSQNSRTILAVSAGELRHHWEADTGKPLPLPGEEERFLTGRMSQREELPGYLSSSRDGRRFLVRSMQEDQLRLSVLRASREKGKDVVERAFLWKENTDFHAALSPDGKTVAAVGEEVVCFLDVATGHERRHAHTIDGRPTVFRTESVKFSPDGARLALVGSDGTMRVLSTNDGRRVGQVATRSRSVQSVDLSPDGQTLLTTTLNGFVCVWEVATGQLVHRLEPATYRFSPDNRLLAASAETLRIVDLYGGRLLSEYQADGNPFGTLTFSPNSKRLAVSCSDTSILVWPTPAPDAGKSPDESSLAQTLATGNATAAYAAISSMIGAPEWSLAFLERRLRPTTKNKEVQGLDAEELLHLRAIQALERIGTKRSRQLLEKLAQGAETSPRTRTANEALKRIETE